VKSFKEAIPERQKKKSRARELVGWERFKAVLPSV